MTSSSSNTTHRASVSYGVALTSSTSHDERAALPSQVSRPDLSRRQSAPGTDYADDAEVSGKSTSDLVEPFQQHRPGDRRSYSYNDASKRRVEFYQDLYRYKDHDMSSARDKAQKHSPVIAELKTNVIVRTSKDAEVHTWRATS